MTTISGRPLLSRRAALSGLACSAAALAGCAMPRRALGTNSDSQPSVSGTATKRTLTVPSLHDMDILFGSYFGTVFPHIRDSWQADNPDITLLPQSQGIPDLAGVFGDQVDGNISLAPLRPILQPLNFDWKAVSPRALGSFQDVNAIALALPLSLGEVQFYANHAALHKLGADKAKWSFEDIKTVLEVQRLALGDANQAPLIVGLGPWDPNLWATFVLGLGGKIAFSGDSLDVRALTDATRALASFSRRYGWDVSSTAVYTANRHFLKSGFSGAAGSALFAFFSPWTGIGAQATPPHDLIPLPFPTFPYANNVPAFQASGMGIRVESDQPELAGRFLAWLYQPKQQELLISLGFPPCATSAGLQAAWDTVQSQNVGKGFPLFSMSGYLDVQALSPNPAVAFPIKPLNQIFTPGGDVEAGLQQLQGQYAQDLAEATAHTRPKGY